MKETKLYSVEYRWSYQPHDIDVRAYSTLGRALAGIRQGLNPRPPGRGCVGADLHWNAGPKQKVWLGHAGWGDGVYWLDTSEAGMRMGLKDDPEGGVS